MSTANDALSNPIAVSYTRLAAICRQIVDEAEAIGDVETPRCGVPPHLIRRLRNELDGTPQPTGFATMGA